MTISPFLASDLVMDRNPTSAGKCIFDTVRRVPAENTRLITIALMLNYACYRYR